MRALESLARQAPGQLTEAIGLELSPSRARLVGVVPQAIILGDGDHKVRVTTTVGAVPRQAGGVVIAAVSPGSAKTSGRYISWGGLLTAVQGQRWPRDIEDDVLGVAMLASFVQADVDAAAVAKPEQTWERVVGGASPVPPESRLAIAVASMLGPTWGAVEGPSWRPVVEKSRLVGGSVSHRVELSLAGCPQLALLVRDGSVHGPTWKQRQKDHDRYVAAIGKMAALASEEMQPGGWLCRTGDVLAGRGWQLSPGHPDHLLEAAGIAAQHHFRPPNGAGLLWKAPNGMTLGKTVDSLALVTI